MIAKMRVEPKWLDSALARPVNRWNCGKDDPAALAAAYAFGVARNRPFINGNKRTTWEIEEDVVAAWFRERLAD